MKVKDIEQLTVSQTDLAKALNLTRTRIFQLIEEKVIVRDESDPKNGVLLFQSVANYYSSKKDHGINYWTEKAEHERVKREINELKLRELEKQVYSAAEIEAVWLRLLKMIGRKYGVDALHEMMADVDSEEVFEKYEQVVRDAEETSFNGDRTNNAAECE